MKTINITKKLQIHFYRNYSGIFELGISVYKEYLCFKLLFWSIEIDW